MNTQDNQTVDIEPAEELPDPPSGGTRRSPGAMLAAQRETLELSIQQVADQLNLTMHFVRAIEADCYDKLPGEVFVRGYIRAYSNLLRLDPVQILLIFDEFTSQKIARKEEAIKRRDRRRKDKNRPWILFSGFAFVAVAVALWYLNPAAPVVNQPEQPVSVATPALSVLSAVPLETPVSAVGQAPEPQAENTIVANQRAPGTEAALEPTMLSQTQEADSGLSDFVPDAQVAAQQEMDPGAAPISELDPDSSLAPTDSDADATLATRAVTHNWAGADELTLSFGADCWVEIEHRGGDEVYQNASRAGDTLVIKGTAPFSVLLGNARDVELTFNGRNMDISSNIRADNTARLSIGM
ncbi:helix-turn-helix domain-containing protein [Gammaproteobacteria bacterium LSUCC0112]|nr:helix-turn-helix domain-containing protein [Gammaproteobacteria bacterium LSUCC0112]